MDALEQDFAAAFANRELPGVVLTAQDVNGKINYAKAIGTSSLKDGAAPMTLDSTFWLASCSKLVTSIAALQSVERGHFTLDEDVTRILPEFKGIQILKGFEESGEPILVPSKNHITLRQLLTHSSGISYDHFDPTLIRYRAWQKYPIDFNRPGKSDMNYFYPLLFEPGTSYAYGAGIDWAGVMTCRVNGNVTLEEYFKKNIIAPLNITQMTFHLDQNPIVQSNLAGTNMRSGGVNAFGVAADPNGKLGHTDYEVIPQVIEDDIGGAGLISSATDYQKILSSLTANDGKLLSPAMVLEMAKPNMSPEARATFMAMRKIPEIAQFQAQGQALGAELDFGLGSCVNLADTPEGRKKGTIFWTGMMNTYWWVDIESGVSGTMFMTVLPMGDAKGNEFFNKFQRAVYNLLES